MIEKDILMPEWVFNRLSEKQGFILNLIAFSQHRVHFSTTELHRGLRGKVNFPLRLLILFLARSKKLKLC